MSRSIFGGRVDNYGVVIPTDYSKEELGQIWKRLVIACAAGERKVVARNAKKILTSTNPQYIFGSDYQTGSTPLHFASQKGNFNSATIIIALIQKYHPELLPLALKSMDKSGYTPKEVAKNDKTEEVIFRADTPNDSKSAGSRLSNGSNGSNDTDASTQASSVGGRSSDGSNCNSAVTNAELMKTRKNLLLTNLEFTAVSGNRKAVNDSVQDAVSHVLSNCRVKKPFDARRDSNSPWAEICARKGPPPPTPDAPGYWKWKCEQKGPPPPIPGRTYFNIKCRF